MSQWYCDECEKVVDVVGVHVVVETDDRQRCEWHLTDACSECLGMNNTLKMLCDVEGCGEIVSCGWQQTDGRYRTTCGDHYLDEKP